MKFIVIVVKPLSGSHGACFERVTLVDAPDRVQATEAASVYPDKVSLCVFSESELTSILSTLRERADITVHPPNKSESDSVEPKT